MKRSTAIRHLEEMAGVASERLRLRETDIGWPLEELWVTGDLLGLADTLEAGSVVLVLDVPAGELPWLARHPAGEWVGDQLRLGRRPMRWCYCPLLWPVLDQIYRLDDLISGECFFVATGVTGARLLRYPCQSGRTLCTESIVVQGGAVRKIVEVTTE